MTETVLFDISKDNLGGYGPEPVFVAIGEVMVRDTPADAERPERTRLVHLSMAGSEYSVAVGLARLGIPSAFVTRVPDNPYGRAARNIARANGVNTDYYVWAGKTDLMGRMIFELGQGPRKDSVVYQRKYSAASRLDSGMVDWQKALAKAQILHSTGITFGLAAHSGYKRNYNLEAFKEALASKGADCWVGLDWNYRSTLWSLEDARRVMTPILGEHVDIFITSVYDMAQFYGLNCGSYSARQILSGEASDLTDADLRSFAQQVFQRFNVQLVAITLRRVAAPEQQQWESAAVARNGDFFRSPAVKPLSVNDRLGGGDAWTAGFYYGLLTAGRGQPGIAKGMLVGDACTRLKHTLMFDLPILDREEVNALLKQDTAGTSPGVSR